MQVKVGELKYDVVIWDPSMPVMHIEPEDPVIAVDTETEMLDPAKPVVPVIQQVCNLASREVHIVHWDQMDVYNARMFKDPGTLWALHTAPFDLHVMGMGNPDKDYLRQAVESGRVVDIGLRWLLKELNEGRVQEKWALDFMAKLELGLTVVKDDAIRLSFRRGMTLTEEHLRYAATDPIVTGLLFRQMPVGCESELTQLLGFIALNAIGRRGMQVDLEFLRKQHAAITLARQKNEWVLATFGYRAKTDGNQKILQNILAYIEGELQFLEKNPGLKFQRTDKAGLIATTDSSLEVMGILEHPFIEAYKEAAHQTKMLSTYLNEKLVYKDGRVHPVFEPVKKTGRTSCRGPNVQNPPREPGYREIYMAADGHLYYVCDYSMLELCTLAESCLLWYGESQMATLLNQGVDLHKWFAGQIVGKKVEDVLSEERQMAKACYSEDTEFLTVEGWRSVKELYETGQNRQVMQYCPHTEKLSFATPSGWLRKKDTLIQFSNDHTDLRVTPDHRMLAVSRSGYVIEQLARDYKANEQFSSVHGGFLDKTTPDAAFGLLTRLAVMIQAARATSKCNT